MNENNNNKTKKPQNPQLFKIKYDFIIYKLKKKLNLTPNIPDHISMKVTGNEGNGEGPGKVEQKQTDSLLAWRLEVE